MTANANVVDLVKGNSTLVRPMFSPGLLLRDDDLKVGVDYTRELSRLLFQSLFGCGVVCGLTVTSSVQCGKLLVTIARGVALNGIGDPIYVPSDTTITLDPTCGKPVPPKLWVVLCRTEKCCAPRSAVCGCDDEDTASVCTREQEWFEIRLVKEAPGDCVCQCSAKGPQQPSVPSSKAKTVGSSKAAKAPQAATVSQEQPGCACADPCEDCYKDHYAGECCCDCCGGDCVVLALLTASQPATGTPAGTGSQGLVAPIVDHSVRRFVRPVLMRDPVVWLEQNPGQALCPASNVGASIRQAK
jgi:hypothetical protein